MLFYCFAKKNTAMPFRFLPKPYGTKITEFKKDVCSFWSDRYTPTWVNVKKRTTLLNK